MSHWCEPYAPQNSHWASAQLRLKGFDIAFCSVYLRHSEGLSPLNLDVLTQTVEGGSKMGAVLIFAGDLNMGPGEIVGPSGHTPTTSAPWCQRAGLVVRALTWIISLRRLRWCRVSRDVP